MRRSLALAVTAVAVVGLPQLGQAAPPKPITENYTAFAPTPDPASQVANGTCNTTIPTARDRHEFKVPAKGMLTVSLKNVADWALAVRDDKGETLASVDGGSPADVEKLSIKVKKKMTVLIDACNWAGEPQVPVTVSWKP